MVEKKKHIDEIDIAKGIGIFLVVLGHCFPDVSAERGVSVPLFRAVHDVEYTFHMPLMFFLAGFLSQRVLKAREGKDKIQFIKDRFVRLMLPYFSIGLLYMPIKMILARFAAQPFDLSNLWQIFLGENPNGGLWYLYDLFVIQVVLVLICSKTNIRYLLPISAVLSVVLAVLGLSFYRIDDAIYYLFFVLFDLRFGMVYKEESKIISCETAWFSIIGFLISTYCCLKFAIEPLKFLCGITGTIAVVGLSIMLSKSSGGQFVRCLKYLGTHSMDIYVLHGMVMVAIRIPLWSMLKLNYYFCTVVMFVGGLIIPIMVSELILRKVKIFKLLFLGEKTMEATT
mgnify:CR=1 FL=1